MSWPLAHDGLGDGSSPNPGPCSWTRMRHRVHAEPSERPARRSGPEERGPTPLPRDSQAGTPVAAGGHAHAPSLASRQTCSAPPPIEDSTPRHGVGSPGPERAATPASRPLSNDVPIQEPAQPPQTTDEVPDRTETASALAENHSLGHGKTTQCRSSVAGSPPDDDDDDTTTPAARPETLRSIFPTYDPGLSLAQQPYAPAHIPRARIGRRSACQEPASPTSTTPPRPPPPTARGPRPPPPAPPDPTPCATADLQPLWRAANGWKAPAPARQPRPVFCLRLAPRGDHPVYTLSSASGHPFWRLRLDPTSSPATRVTLARRDPAKGHRPPRPAGAAALPARKDWWREALTTEMTTAEARRDDGLVVAALHPSPATKSAAARANDPACVLAAENESARLVWDADTSAYLVVHNALAKPFRVAAERHPALMRVEHTLEHDESPRHVARLTRDATGGGYLEVDVRVAGQIPACYILDVAVAALLLVAVLEEGTCPARRGTTFEPPPPPPAVLRPGKPSRWRGVRPGRRTLAVGEASEADVESQSESLGKDPRGACREELPWVLRLVLGLGRGLLALGLWTLTVLVKCLGGVFKLVYKCVGSKY